MDKMDTIQNKIVMLDKTLEPLLRQGLGVAFSGGVDSAALLKESALVLKQSGGALHAVLFATQLHPAADEAEARRLAGEIGVPLTVLRVDEFENPRVMENPLDRCYHCKHMLFLRLKEFCGENGLGAVADGTNFDDLSQYRPGLQALRELEIASPLAECGFTKAEVRQLAERHGLSVSRKPSSPCLATRLPYNTTVTRAALSKIQQGERLLAKAGFPVNRLRYDHGTARIEIPKEEFEGFLEISSTLVPEMKKIGFDYVSLDLEGFRSGSMDEPFLKNKLAEKG